MRVVKILFFCHLAALVFGIAGLLVMLPHPELWSWNPFLIEVFDFGIRYAGSLHIIFGAATMLLFGLLFVGHEEDAHLFLRLIYYLVKYGTDRYQYGFSFRSLFLYQFSWNQNT